MVRIPHSESPDANLFCQISSTVWNQGFHTFNTFIPKSSIPNVDKLESLTNHATTSIYKHTTECKTYGSGLCTLEKMYLNPKNEVFIWYLLSSCEQETSQTLDQLHQELKLLVNDCGFKPTTAEENQNGPLCDAFAGGMQPNFIRQRILEDKTLRNIRTGNNRDYWSTLPLWICQTPSLSVSLGMLCATYAVKKGTTKRFADQLLVAQIQKRLAFYYPW